MVAKLCFASVCQRGSRPNTKQSFEEVRYQAELGNEGEDGGLRVVWRNRSMKPVHFVGDLVATWASVSRVPVRTVPEEFSSAGIARNSPSRFLIRAAHQISHAGSDRTQ